MSANSFRMFARKCCLIHQSSSLTVAAIDILYIEIQRKYVILNSVCLDFWITFCNLKL